MGRSGCCFLREHGSNKLAVTVEIERPFNPDQGIVRRAEIDSPTPNNATAFLFDNTAHGQEIKVNRRERLHGIGCSRWRGDRAR